MDIPKDIPQERTCRQCGEQTHSRNQRIEHDTRKHTPSPAQWSEAYKTVEKMRHRKSE